MKKIKTLVLAAATAATVAAPIAATVSCGASYSGRYDAKNDNKLIIMTSLSNKQLDGINAVVEAWNTSKPADAMKMEVVRVEGGYSAIHNNLSKSFMAKDMDKLPNIIVDYPDSLGTLVKYHMTQPLVEGTDKEEVESKFDSKFLAVNNEIGGLANGGLYALPIAKSIDMATVNKPVFAHVIKQLIDQKWLAMSDAPSFVTEHQDDVTSIWGNAKANTDAAQTKTFTWKQITENASDLLDFVAFAAPKFEQKAKDAYMLGLDSATNFVYQSVYQKVGAKMADFLFSKASNGYIQYNWRNNPTAKAAFTEVYSKLQAALEAKGVYINTGGAYSSSYETQHKIAMAFGSTAGYWYNFVGATSTQFALAEDGKTKVMFTSNTYPFSETAGDADKLGTFANGSHVNNVYFSSFAGTAANGNYDHKIDADKEAAVKAWYAAQTEKSKIYLSTASNAAQVKAANKVEFAKGKYLIKMDGAVTPEATMQKEEMLILNTTSKWNASSAASQLIQGPSFIGVHSNAAEDAQMQKFIHWYMTATVKGQAPYQIFASTAHYLTPTKDILNTPIAASEDDATKLTYNTLKAIQNGTDNLTGFDNPVDATTGDFRDTLQTTIAAAFKQIDNGQSTTFSVDDIYNGVQRSIRK